MLYEVITLFIGIEVKDNNAMVFCRKLMEEGLVVNDSHGHTIRISPPLVINDQEMDFMVDRLVITSYSIHYTKLYEG